MGLLFTQGGKGKFCTKDYNTATVFEENQFGSSDRFTEEDTTATMYDTNINGLGCVDNKTLNFYALDLETQRVLGESIGLDFEKDPPDNQVKFVIVSPDQEEAYEMN